MTRYVEYDDQDTWSRKYDNCDCDDITSLSDARKIIDKFIISNPTYALTSEDPKIRKRATELFKKRQEYQTKLQAQLKKLEKYGIDSESAIRQLPQLKIEIQELGVLLAEISSEDICITQLAKSLTST